MQCCGKRARHGQAAGPEEANTWSCTERFLTSLRAPGDGVPQQGLASDSYAPAYKPAFGALRGTPVGMGSLQNRAALARAGSRAKGASAFPDPSI